MFDEVVHNFVKSDGDTGYLVKKCLFSLLRCIHGFIPNSIKKSVTVSIVHTSMYYCNKKYLTLKMRCSCGKPFDALLNASENGKWSLVDIRHIRLSSNCDEHSAHGLF